MACARLRASRRSSRGVTLIEIIVVVAVAGIFAALTIPVFTTARARAHEAICASHLKQLGVAVRLYLQYNDDYYFPFAVNTDEGTLYYFGVARKDPETGRGELDVTKGYLFNYYARVEGIERCPAFDLDSLFDEGHSGVTLGYGYNRFGLAGQKATRIRNHDSIALFADCAVVLPVELSSGKTVPRLKEFHYIGPSRRTVHFRHLGRANVLFCDGHVESRPPVEMHDMLPGARVGRLNEPGDDRLFIPK